MLHDIDSFLKNTEQLSPDGLLIDIDRADCQENFIDFIKRSWHIIEPGQPYIHNWHIDMICDHLQAITDGVMINNNEYYNRVLINVPPGAMKSLLVGVFWPAWEWGPKNLTSMRYVCASHSMDLAIRDSTKMRRLVQSEWYQARWGDTVVLTGDQNAKTKFENTKTGFRQAIASGSITGARGDRVIIDDPHSVESAASEQMRKTTIDWFKEAVPTRLNNPDRSAIVVIMQRLHEEDVSGVILDNKLGYDHIMLPMEYDPSRAAPTMLGHSDPRDEVGELLFEERFPRHVVDRDKKILGPYAVSGQFQQTPSPADGGIIKRDWWQLWEDANIYPQFDYILASLDTAYTEKTENDASAMTIWGVFSEEPTAIATRKIDADGTFTNFERSYSTQSPKVMMIYAWQERLELHALVEKVYALCKRMRVETLLIENKAAGIPVAQELRRIGASKGFQVILDDPKSLDKTARLYSIQHLFSEGIVYSPDRAWADMVIQQCAVFPKGKHDDLVDTVSMALRYMRRTNMVERNEEVQDHYQEMIKHKGAPPVPLYNA